MGHKVKKLKPLARVKTFLVAGKACAWIGQDDLVEEWEVESVRTSAPFASSEWYAAAFAAACIAYKRLQRRLPEREVVWCTDNTPVGRPLRLDKSITYHLLPQVAGLSR